MLQALVRQFAKHAAAAAKVFSELPAPLRLRGKGPSARLHVGYVSSDWGHHTGSVLASVLSMHDRARVKVCSQERSMNVR